MIPEQGWWFSMLLTKGQARALWEFVNDALDPSPASPDLHVALFMLRDHLEGVNDDPSTE